jgi:hypothetical protein
VSTFFISSAFEMIFLIKLIFCQVLYPFHIIMPALMHILILHFIDYTIVRIKPNYLLVALVTIFIEFLSKFDEDNFRYLLLYNLK